MSDGTLFEGIALVFGDCDCAECAKLRPRLAQQPAPRDPYVYRFECTEAGVTMTCKVDTHAIAQHQAAVRRLAVVADPTLTVEGRNVLRTLFWRGPQPLTAFDTTTAEGLGELVVNHWVFPPIEGWVTLSENGVGAALVRGFGKEKERAGG